ncbi:hypothetical protein EN925_00920 [Mesorhizobium sp. M7A.F.Ca.US.006.04.2.1]|nr:hypothetical protein EN990_21590 [Mesorhizobium sp. M7A.F.Ca.US.005.03.1.1]RUY19365.1 hypothetical protein EN991_00630 [Mesorhizobium sp. M7A.F.Ca.US.005.03.2.1]RVA96652.1 hypothetical protein EN925_00920 [Mesorhizobium sp. M7A.F.Ca.US.006.04.2.1]
MNLGSKVVHLEVPSGAAEGVDGQQAIMPEMTPEKGDGMDDNSLHAFLTSRLPLALVRIDKRASSNQRSTYCRVFRDIDQAVAWAQASNLEGDHIYVINNAPPEGWAPRNGNPPKEAEIALRTRLQVDLDPAGEDHDTARKHALEVIGSMPLQPTMIVDSGRGIQAHWDLVEPTGDMQKAKSANEALIAWLRKATSPMLVKVDGVANANRMMRLPGCINHKTGRTAAIISASSDRTYSLEHFAAFSVVTVVPVSSPARDDKPFHPNFADKVSGADPSPMQRDLLHALSHLTPGDLDSVPDLANLPTDLARMQARLGVRGPKDVRLSGDGQAIRVPLDEAGYTESEASLAFAGECVRSGAPLELALSFLVNAHWAIGGHASRQNDKFRAAQRALAEAILNNEPAPRVAGVDGAPAFSQEHLALTFAEAHCSSMRYVPEWDQWLVWDGHRWAKDKTLDVHDRVRHLARDAARRVDKASEAYRLCLASTSAAVERLARSDRRLAVPAEIWDGDLRVLNTPDGIVDLDTGKVLSHDPSAHCTKMARVGPAGEGIAPERFLRFLSEVTDGDQEYVDYLQRMCGYFLSGETSEHALFFAWGTGRNGKSVFVNTVRFILGDYGTSTATDTLTANSQPQHPTELADLRGARLVTVQETEDGRRWAEARIKQMTGGDPIKARFMRQDFFEYLPQFKLFIAGNHRPGFTTVDEAIRRRIHLLPFTVTISEKNVDRNLEGKLREEAPAILRWMIDGYSKWRADGLERPARVKAATQEYLQDEDLLGRWISECCDRDLTHKEPVADLFESYMIWCRAANERAFSKKKFSSSLKDRGERHDDTGGKRGFIGLRLTADARAAVRSARSVVDAPPF